MIVAQKLRKENIAEYLIYMWQIEDLIRANHLDIDAIKKNIIDKFDQSIEVKEEIADWYESLIEMMRAENAQEKGHLIINQNTVRLLTDFHLQLLKSPKHSDYSAVYYKTLPYIVELRAKSGDKNLSEIETCFAALYGMLLMRMKGQEISTETLVAMQQITNLIRLLSMKFKEDEENNLEI